MPQTSYLNFKKSLWSKECEVVILAFRRQSLQKLCIQPIQEKIKVEVELKDCGEATRSPLYRATGSHLLDRAILCSNPKKHPFCVGFPFF